MSTISYNPKQTMFWIVCLFLTIPSKVFSQTISLEDIWLNNTFAQKSFDDYQFSTSGNTYFKTILNPKTNKTELALFDLITDKKRAVKCILSDFKFSNKALEVDEYFWDDNETKLLLQTQTEYIYRRSTKAVYYVYDLATQKLEAVADTQKLTQCGFSPDAKKIAYTKDNNLYIKDLVAKKTNSITKNGKLNTLIHGTSDWVYEEEFEIVKCFFWNKLSNKIAFLTFDESDVKTYNMQIWGNDLYPIDYIYKYPKAGEKNAKVSVSVYDTETNTTKLIFDGNKTDAYVPRLSWTNNNNVLSVTHLNRNQDSLTIVHYNVINDSTHAILNLTSGTYVSITDDFYYLKNNDLLLYKSNDNENNIQILDLKSKKITPLTNAKIGKYYDKYPIQYIVAVDEKNKKIYYTAKDIPPLNQHLFSINFDGTNNKKLTTIAGVNSVNIDPTCQYFLLTNSTIKQGNSYSLHYCSDGSKIKDLESNNEFKEKIIKNKFVNPTFHSFTYIDSTSKSTSSDGNVDYNSILLNYYLIKPHNFDSTKKYPVLVYFYGGPGSQEVINEWQGKNYLWFQHLLSQGFIVACCDNRGTGGRGMAFQQSTNHKLGQYETQDQIAFGRFLCLKPYVDASKMATFGWSFGGYLSLLTILKGSDVFGAAIAVAPVTSWRFYDTIYTERYLKNPTDNAKGYDDNSPLNFANNLKGKLLLIHGTGDDNVHYQNTIAMQQALQHAGKHFETYTYPDKSHGISGGKTRFHLYQKMTNFLLDFAKNKSNN